MIDLKKLGLGNLDMNQLKNIDAKGLLDQLTGAKAPGDQKTVGDRAGQAVQMAKDNPLAAGALAAVLLGTSTGRSVLGTGAKVGGLAAIATLGYKAWQNYSAGKPILPQKGDPAALPDPNVIEGTAFDPAETTGGEAGAVFTLSLVRIMIAAARADGHIDDAERTAILGKLKTSGINEDVQAFIDAEISNPVDLDAIIAAAQTEPQKVELYTAARLAISPDTRAERGFLDMLAGRLGLADALVDHIDATVKGAEV
jgi:uncharacterized membrane protein YebE (DUF533 family)